MPTINQLVRKPRRQQRRFTKAPVLDSCPQRQGVCLQVRTMTPKKPNSALRKITRVRLDVLNRLSEYVDGRVIGHFLPNHLQRIVEHALRDRLFAVVHQAIDELGRQDRVIHGIRLQLRPTSGDTTHICCYPIPGAMRQRHAQLI